MNAFQKLFAYFAGNTEPRNWSVSFGERGRDGYVYYSEFVVRAMSFYWEFGGGDTVAIVSYGSVEEWKKEYPWAVERRPEILDRVAKEVIRQRAPGCRAVIDEKSNCIYIKQG
jgi:hypothetical protein